MRYLLGLLITMGLGAVATHANAGCPNVCDMTVTMPEVTPPLPCANIKSLAEDCDCGVRLQLFNDCDAPLEASGFQFDACSSKKECTAAQPGEYASVVTPLGVTGHRDYSYELIADDGPHTVTFSSEVIAFDDGNCVCTLPGARGGVGTGWGWMVVGAVAAIGRRRSRQLPGRESSTAYQLVTTKTGVVAYERSSHTASDVRNGSAA